MQRICIIFAALLALAVTGLAQPILRSGWTTTTDPIAARAALGIYETNAAAYNVTNTIYTTTTYSVTNWGGLALNTVFVDALAGNDTTGDGSPTAPVATLSKGQDIATDGSTVFAARGTFNEANLFKSGVRWFFAPGVVLTGNPTFLITNNNERLVVRGEADQIGGSLVSVSASNTWVDVQFRKASNCMAAYYQAGGAWNWLSITCESATNIPNGFISLTANAASNEQFRASVTVKGELHANFNSAANDTAQAKTNRVIRINAHPWRIGQSFSQASQKGTFIIEGGFTRAGATWNINTANQVVAWRGAYVTTTNDLPGNSTNNTLGVPLILNP